LDVCLKEGPGASECLVAFGEDRGEGLEDVSYTGGYSQGDGDVMGCRSGGQSGGVVEQRSSILELTTAGQSLLNDAGAVFDEELETFLRAPVAETSFTQLATTLASLRAAAANTSAEPC
jgi:hypothetical protein